MLAMVLCGVWWVGDLVGEWVVAWFRRENGSVVQCG